MMKRTIYIEFYKLLSSKMWWVVCGIVLVFQPVLGYTSAKSVLSIGLSATPETTTELLQAIPPVDYLGFDTVGFGLLPMVILGGMVGANEFTNHQLRTTLLSQSNRTSIFIAKVVAVAVSSAVISFIATYLTIFITHQALGTAGLDPFRLSSIAWHYVLYSVLGWLLLTLISFAIGLLFKNSLVPILFLVPQVYNLGNSLAQKWSWGHYLPVAASNSLIATPTDEFAHMPLQGTIILLSWVMGTLILAFLFFRRDDLGGKY